MKNIKKVLVILISLLSVITTTGVAAELSPSNHIMSQNNRFKFIYKDKGESRKFLEKNGMLPGDYIEGTLKIFNNLDEPFRVYITTNKINSTENSELYKVLDISVKDKENNKIIFNGRLLNVDGKYNDLYIGIINPGEQNIYDVKVTLDINATNKYKNKIVDDEWQFLAIGTKDNKEITSLDDGINNSTEVLENTVNNIKSVLPKTGYNYLRVLGIGSLIICVGICILLVKKRGSKDEEA